ncbi:MAG: hypothetical protein A2W19_10925 [Spirochaetes bacterium RBG_16_49_21]|nr:MAG: hypothetical protein A2W19_10925 [Spirochaetes bacterium RBG_16_49_21]
MKNKIIGGIVSALMLGFAGLYCAKDDVAITKDTYGIITKGYSALRIEPMVFAGIIIYLGKGESVEIAERSREKSWVGKMNDFWYKIKTKDGTVGWVFGDNIIIHSSKSKVTMDKIASDFMEREALQIKKYLAGKWWSVNKFGDFTNHCLELYENNKYRSYQREQESRAIVGRYRLDFNRNEIIFSSGTSFRSNLDLLKRGNEYEIKKNIKERELRFAKIGLELPPEPVLTTKENTKKP